MYHGVPCVLGDGSDISHSMYLRTAFMAKVVVHAC